MSCDTVRSFIHAYVDSELPAGEQLSIEEHLASCGPCAEVCDRALALRHAIQTSAPKYRAPEGLDERIRASVRRTARSRFDWRWAGIAAAALIAVVSVWSLRSLPSRSEGDLMAKEMVASHVRSLMANHLIDEPSSDQHTVKPWFAGKLDFSPPVKNLDAQGFILAGGRLDYEDRHSAAVLVYRRRQHVINLFIWPSTEETNEHAFNLSGYNAIHWSNGGMTYWAISDLNKQELQLFSRLIGQ